LDRVRRVVLNDEPVANDLHYFGQCSSNGDVLFGSCFLFLLFHPAVGERCRFGRWLNDLRYGEPEWLHGILERDRE
jgi:hypothetical protein